MTTATIPNLKNHRRPSLISSAISNWMVLVVNAAVAIVLTPLIVRHIGKDGYGIWTLVSSLIGYYGLLRMGVGTAIMRYISLNDGRGDKHAVDGTFSTAMAIYVGVGALIIILSFTCADLLSRFFEQGQEFVYLIYLLGIATALSCPCAVLEAVLRSREKYVLTNMVMLALSIIRGIGMAICLFMGYRLIGLAVVTLVLSVFDIFVMGIAFKKGCSDIRFSFSEITSAHLRYLMSFGAMVTLVTIGIMLRYNSDRVIVGKLFPMEVLGIYSVVTTLIVNFRNIMRATTRALNPRFSFLDGKDDMEGSIALFLKSTKMTAVLCAGMCLIISVAGPSFVRLWVGPGFESGYSTLVILALGHMVGQTQTVSAAVLNGYGKQGALAAYTIVEGIFSIGLGVLLGKYYGLAGVAIGSVIPMVIMQGILFPLYMCSFMKIKVMYYYKECLVPVWVLSVIILVGCRLFVPLTNITTWGRFVAFSAMIALLFTMLAYQFIFNFNERFTIGQRVLAYVPMLAFAQRKS